MRAAFISIRSLLRWLGGFDELILERCRTEGMRATATGVLVLVVGGMAASSATFTASLFLHLALAGALVFGMCWGLAIMALDRWLLLVIKRQRTTAGTLILAVPRVLLALVAGLVIAQPLVLVAFRSEVAREAQWDRQQTVQSRLTSVDDRYDPPINSLTSTEKQLQAQLATANTSSALTNDPLYQADQRQALRLANEAHAAFAAANSELDGTGGTHHVGAGPVYDRKLAYAQMLQREAQTAARTAQARATIVIGQQQSALAIAHEGERQRLAAVLHRLRNLEGDRARGEMEVQAEYGGPIGLADRLDALAAIGRIHPSVGRFSLLLTLLLMLVDSAPALGKVLLLVGVKTAYEVEANADERATQEASNAERDAEVEARRLAAQEVVDQAAIHRQRWNETLDELVGQIIEVQRRVTEEAIRQWDQRICDQLRRDESGGPPPASSPPQQTVQTGARRRPRVRLTPRAAVWAMLALAQPRRWFRRG